MDTDIYIRKLAAAMTAVITTLLFALLLPVRGFAEGASAAIAVREDIAAGNDFFVTVNFSAPENIGRVTAELSYSSEHIEYIGSDLAEGGGGIVNISGSPEKVSDNMTVILHFKALTGGSSDIELRNGSIISETGAVLSSSLTASAQLNAKGDPPVTLSAEPELESEPRESFTEDSSPETTLTPESAAESPLEESTAESAEEESSDDTPVIPDDGGAARLKSLTVSAGELKPAFSPDIFEYEVTVPPDTEYISVEGELREKYDTIWYEGSEYLGIGMTPWTITVTTADGTISHAYSLRITRHTEDYVDPSSSDTSGSEDSVTPITETSSASEELERLEDTSHSPTVISEVPAPHEDRPIRERIMPLLITGVCLIAVVVAVLIIRIHVRSKRDYQNFHN